jgi:hypothetical protein
MIPYDLDPSLHTAAPEPTLLDDGFSPPQHEPVAADPEKRDPSHSSPPVDPALWAKSAF